MTDQTINTCMHVLHYSDELVLQHTVKSIEEISNIQLSGEVTWLRVIGLHNAAFVQALCKKFNVHPLAVEDILHTRQRAKVEDYHDFIFLVLRVFCVEKNIFSQQVSFVVRDNLLISFEESVLQSFNCLAQKIVRDTGCFKHKGEDYLLYSLLDSIVDNYYDIEEYVSSSITKLEDEISVEPRKQHFRKILTLKREIISLRKNISPMRELVSNLSRYNVSFFEEANKPYLRDLQDHIVRAFESIEAFRDLTTHLMDLYHSQINNKMNEVMKTLTVISAIFIPLTFIVGIYGMNFDNMPELRHHYGYFYTLGGMGLIALFLLLYFRFKKYI